MSRVTSILIFKGMVMHINAEIKTLRKSEVLYRQWWPLSIKIILRRDENHQTSKQKSHRCPIWISPHWINTVCWRNKCTNISYFMSEIFARHEGIYSLEYKFILKLFRSCEKYNKRCLLECFRVYQYWVRMYLMSRLKDWLTILGTSSLKIARSDWSLISWTRWKRWIVLVWKYID